MQTVRNALCRLLSGLLLLAALCISSEQRAHAQSIVNVAEARWNSSGETQTVRSNRVELALEQAPPLLELFVPAGDGQTLNLRSSACTAQDDSIPGEPGELRTISVAPAQTISAGTDLVLRVAAGSANRSGSTIDTLVVILTSGRGETETITIFETGADSGVFTGSIQTRIALGGGQSGDCILDVESDAIATVEVLATAGGERVLEQPVAIEVAPVGLVFDSQSGAPISGAAVTLVDASTGLPAILFDESGSSPWPATLVSGQSIVLSSGKTVRLGPGQFWFPHVPPGRYRLRVEPPQGFIAPSRVPAQIIRSLRLPDGTPVRVPAGAFGDEFSVAQAGGLAIDIPLDRATAALQIQKSVSRSIAQPGDVVLFTAILTNPDPHAAQSGVTLLEDAPESLRLQKGSVRIDGQEVTQGLTFAADGTGLALDLGAIPPGGTRRIVYAMNVRTDALPGNLENRSTLSNLLGEEINASASLRVIRESVVDRMTIIGRVSAGDCSIVEGRIGIPGVRIMMEDGSFAITDSEGRFHFDGVTPGTHVVHAIRATLPDGAELLECIDSNRSAGSPHSQFVIGRGGSLLIADFHIRLPVGYVINQDARVTDATEVKTAEVDDDSLAPVPARNWLTYGDGPIGWLAPEVDENPRAPAITVAIRHRVGQQVLLTSDGERVSELLFEGVQISADKKWAVSHWHGVPLPAEQTTLVAEIRSQQGQIVETLRRDVFFTTTPARVELVPERSNLIADGKTRPIIAVKVLDAAGRPVRAGVSGNLQLSAPYLSAEQIEQQQLDVTARREPAPVRWTIDSSDGIALIELAPTMISGSLTLDFEFVDREIVRDQQIEAWIIPGDVEWTVIGLAEGSIGARSVAENMERAGSFDSDLGENARVALYAKGRILGRFLTTIAYDSAKQRDDQRLFGALDPDSYYTVFGDASTRLFDAASRENLYLRIEAANFYAVYGDFVTGFDQTRLARYNRTLTGVQGEARVGRLELQGFAAETGSRLRRDEIQGDGLSGPYTLASREIIPNSETVFLEVRDRFRPELILEQRRLQRFIDYEIDLLSGTIRFAQPVLSRTLNNEPQFIIVEYEVDQLGVAALNAGVRASWQTESGELRIGASAFTDSGNDLRTDVAGVDLSARLSLTTQLRAEVAASRSAGETTTGWSVELDHQSSKINGRIYAQSLDADFGVGQQNGVELGTQRIGGDVRIMLDETVFFEASAWQADSIEDDRQRRAAQVSIGHRTQTRELQIGLARFDDRGLDGATRSSTVLEASGAQRLLNNRLELSASTSFALDSAEAVDLPARHTLGARFSVNDAVRLTGAYEIAESDTVSARTLRGGLEVTAWPGGQLLANAGQQSQSGNFQGTFAGLRLAQALALGPALTLNATLDRNWGALAAEPADLVNSPGQPLSSGGQLGPGGSLLEDFTALTLGAAWTHDRWTINARGEYRDGEFADRKGIVFGALRQLGNGSMLGGGATWSHAEGANATATKVFDAAIAFAHRPEDRSLALLGKLEYRSDAVSGAIRGEVGALGRGALDVDGDAISRRALASVSADITGVLDAFGLNDGLQRRSEFGLFAALRHNFDQIEGLDLEATTLIAGISPRIGISRKIEIGMNSTLRLALDGSQAAYSAGPFLGYRVAKNAVFTVGYNIEGFSDADFEVFRQTRKGVFLTFVAKFDDGTLADLGLRQ